MDCSEFKLAPIFIVFLFGITITTGGKPYCTPSSEGTLKECNWCYCLEDGTPICTTMNCTKIPKEMWGKLDIPLGHKKKRLSLPEAAFSAATKGLAAIIKMLGSTIMTKIMPMFAKKTA